MDNESIAFKIIIYHLRDTHFGKSIRDIHRNHVLSVCPELDFSPFKRAFRYSQYFGFIEKRSRNNDWYIKLVDDMANRLRGLNCNRYYELPHNPDTGLVHPISLAFGIIVHHFNNQTVPETTIERKIRTEIENYPGELSQYNNNNVVPHTLNFLNHFGFAEKTEKTGRSDWHIKSVNDMCQRLHALAHSRNLSN